MRKGIILSNDYYRDLLKDSGEAVQKAIRERLFFIFSQSYILDMMEFSLLDYYVIDLLEIIYVYPILYPKVVYRLINFYRCELSRHWHFIYFEIKCSWLLFF